MSTLADLIVTDLQRAGVRAVFGVPGGGSNLDLIEAAGKAGLPFVLTSTETGGAIAAMAQAEITGQPGACLTTLGPGVSSVVNGVACAFLDRAPLMVFTDSHPSAARGAFEHQRLDHAALLGPVAKWSRSLEGDAAVETLLTAFLNLETGRPGPVHLDCPGDVLRGPMEARVLRSGLTRGSEGPPLPRPTSNERLQTLIQTARRPLLLVGLGARGKNDAPAIRALCERCRVPAMVTYKAKGVVPDHHPWFAGVFTNAMIEQALIADSDLLIGIGLDPVELIPRVWRLDRPVVYCGPWPVEDQHVPFAGQLITDVPSAVRWIESLLRESAWSQSQVRHAVEEQRRAISVPAQGLTAQRVVYIAAERLARTSRVAVDAGAHMFPATVLWPVFEPNQMLNSNGLSTMGFALPAAIGAALLDRDRPVVALTGDGGLLMCAGELLTAVRERLRIMVIVFSDASLSLIEIKQQARKMTPAGVALGMIDWPALAESVGMRGLRATTEAEVNTAIEHAIAGAGPTLIEARIDRSNYGATLRAVRG